MECNKDEASRAKSIAEGKLEMKDYSGAKKFALKAQSLYPGLDGISQMLKTLDVYVSAENTIFGLVDWYGVLGVNPSADDATIKKQYRKLALMVHPDKNSCIGADGAFKLISEAWKFLSDKAKRLEYNKKREYKGFQQNVQAPPTAPSRPCQPNVSTHGPSAPSRPSHHNCPGPSAPKPQDRSAEAFRKQTHDTSCHQKVPRHTGGPSAPSKPSQPNVSTHSPSAPSRPSQPNVSTHGPSAPSRPSQHKGPGPSAPKPPSRPCESSASSRPSQRKGPSPSAPKPPDKSAEASRKRTHATSAPFKPCQQKVPRHTGGPSSPSKPVVPSAPSRPSKHKGPGPSAPSNGSSPKPLDRSAKASRKQTPGPFQRTIDAFWSTGGPSTPSKPSQHGPSAPSRAPSNCASRKASAPKPLDGSAKVSRPAPPPPTIGKFWTTCRQCGAQHEYLKLFRNCTLLCDKCKKPFTASETVHRPNL